MTGKLLILLVPPSIKNKLSIICMLSGSQCTAAKIQQPEHILSTAAESFALRRSLEQDSGKQCSERVLIWHMLEGLE